jgi:hypothetical protein
VLLIDNQIINYFFTKYSIPKQVVSAVERIGCDGFAVSGMELPFNYLVNTETDIIVHLTHPLAQFDRDTTDSDHCLSRTTSFGLTKKFNVNGPKFSLVG